MPQDPICARPTALAAQSFALWPMATGGQRPEAIATGQQQQIVQIALELRSVLHRQGARISPEAAVEEARLLAHFAKSRHPDELPQSLRCFGDPNAPKTQWRKNYVLATECRGRPVWLAPRGTDFMPVRCLVTAHVGSSRRAVQVIAIKESSRSDHIESLQVLTDPTLKGLKKLAIHEGLALRKGLYWPESRWANGAR